MRPSFVRLVVHRVLFFWAVSIIAILLYSRTREWTHERARGDGVFLIHELLDQTPAPDRAARLEGLRPHSRSPLAIVAPAVVTEQTGQAAAPGAIVAHREFTKAWFYVVFTDGSGALRAGPINPAIPPGFHPVGVVVGVLIIPILASLLALRIERAVSKVERAAEALGVGALDTRIADHEGPSRELAEKFNAMAERIERLVRSRDELVQAVSHELGSPLARVRFNLELLGSQVGADPSGRIEAVKRDLDALDDLVNELLCYVQSDHTEPQRQTIHPEQTLADLAELARLDLPDDRELAVVLDLTAGVTVYADPRLFQRAVENLLRNATVYAHSAIRLTLAQDEGAVYVEIHDDGPGIPEAARRDVTTPFVRLDAARSNRSGRSGNVGLGLAILDRILLAHRGQLVIDRSPLGGARMITVWPKLRSVPAQV